MDYNFLEKTILFRGVSDEEIKEMLVCLGGEVKHYTKGRRFIMREMWLRLWG